MTIRYRFLLLVTAIAPTAVQAAELPSPAEVAARIDRHLEAAWTKAGVRPAPITGDSAFLRRASLDLIGRIPTVAETRAFLADSDSDKRAKLVDHLIDSGGHTRHMATYWRRAWVPQADTQEFARLADGFEAWIAVKLRDNTPYDRMVRDLLTAPNSGTAVPARGAVSPASFFAASEYKPENLAANATRAFLGVNLDCAQCHNHPFSRWTRDQFWQTAAFFVAPRADQRRKPTIAIPNTTRTVGAALMDKSPLVWPEPLADDSARRLLANWVTAKDNPYFARNAVNRVWANLFGLGLVEPLDDLSEDNPSNQPELLDELTRTFIASGFNLKYLTRAVALSKAYQLADTATDGNPRLFARMAIRGLTGEQLYDSLRIAAGLPAERDDVERGEGLAARKRFAAEFRIDRPATAERSIVQALSMMNGRLSADLTDPKNNPTLSAAADAPFLDTAGKLETLYLAVLGRKPSEKTAARLIEYVDGGGPDKDSRKALADVFWALLNSTEFNTNH